MAAVTNQIPLERFTAQCVGAIQANDQPRLSALLEKIDSAIARTLVEGSEELKIVRAALPPKMSWPAIGLKNRQENCWINSALQLFFFLPQYKEMLEKMHGNTEFAPLIEAATQYQDDLGNAGLNQVSAVDSQKLREWLHEKNPSISSDFRVQDDPIALYEVLHDLMNEPLQLQTRTMNLLHGQEYPSGRRGHKGEFKLRIDLNPEVNIPFATLFAGIFQHEEKGAEFRPCGGTDGGCGGCTHPIEQSSRVTKTSFEQAPDKGFLLEVGRTHGVWNDAAGRLDTQKIIHAVDIPLEYTFTEGQSPSGSPTYFVDGFAIHLSSSMGGVHSINGGHYVACINNGNGTWQLLNDTRSKCITQDEAVKLLSKASLIHYGVKRTPLAGAAKRALSAAAGAASSAASAAFVHKWGDPKEAKATARAIATKAQAKVDAKLAAKRLARRDS